MKKYYLFLLTLVLTMFSSVSALAQKDVHPTFSPFLADGETEFYLYNVEAKAFIMGGNDWGSRASGFTKEGNLFRFTDNGNGKFTFADKVNGQWKAMFTDAAGIWVDNANENSSKTWTVTSLPDGTYTISNTSETAVENASLCISPFLSDSRLYFRPTGTEGFGQTWAFVTPADFESYVATVDANNKALRESTVPGTDITPALPVATASLDGWSINNTSTLQHNTWSWEGVSDGTWMTPSFIENWVAKGSLLPEGIISYTIEGLVPNEAYNVSALIRAYNEGSSTQTPAGACFYAGESKSKDISTGSAFVYNGMAGVYGRFTAFDAVADAEGKLTIGIVEKDNNYNWINIRDIKVVVAGAVDVVNGDFAKGVIGNVNIATYAKDGEVSQMQPVPGWTLGIANGDARAAGVAAYGSGTTFGGSTYGVPAAGPEGTNGYALGMVGVWTGTVQYVQDVTLPAGKYTMTVPVYNTTGTTAFVKNLIGVKYGETEIYATATSYPVGKWTVETIKFELAEKTKVTLSLGYQGANVGSGPSQHLFLDCVKIEHNVAVELGTPAFNVEAENPVFAYSQMKEMGGITLKLQESQGITANMTIQANAVLTNSSNETVAEGTFTGNSTDGVKLAFVDAEEAAYNYAVGETYTISVSSIAVKDAAGETKASWEYDAEDPEAQPVGCTFSVDYDLVTVEALPKAYFFPGYDDESVDPVGMCMKFFTETQMYQVLVRGTENGFEIGKEYTSDDMLSMYNLMYDLNTKEKFGFTSVKIVASEGTYGVNYHFVAECKDNCKYDVTFVEDHTLTYVPGVDATDEHAGQAGYYVCDGADGKYEHCGHYFEDAYAVTEIGDDAALEAWKTTGTGALPAKYDENAVYAQICLTNGEYLLVNTKYLQEISNTTEEEANYLQLIYREGTTSINAGKTITYPEAEVKEVKMVNSTTPPLKYYGTAIWHDVFVDNWFNLADDGCNIDFPCNVYRSVIQPNKFYFDSPYNYANIANWWDVTPEEMKPADENWQRALIEIDCTNPQKVSMPAQNLGVCVSTSYGWFSGGSKLPSGGVLGYGTYANNTITFDARSIASSMAKYSNGTYYYVGYEGEYTFTVTITPDANPVGPFYSLEDEGTTSNKAPKKVAANRDAQKSIMNEKFEKVQVRGEKIEMSDIKDNILKSDSDNVLKPGVVVLQGANF